MQSLSIKYGPVDWEDFDKKQVEGNPVQHLQVGFILTD